MTICCGLPAHLEDWGPWAAVGGCCPKDEKWHCSLCNHNWA